MRTYARFLAALALLATAMLPARAAAPPAGEGGPPAGGTKPPAPAGGATTRAGKPAEVKTKYAKYMELPKEKRKLLVRHYVKERSDGSCVVTQSKYRMVSELSGERTLELAIRMDDFYGCLSRLFVGRFKWTGQPEARVFKDRESYAHHLYNELYTLAGGTAALFYVQGSKRLLLAYESPELVEDLQHEGAHQFLYYHLGPAGFTAPTWLHEGFATNLETWDMALGPRANIDESTAKSAWKRRVHRLHKSGRLPELKEFLHAEWRGSHTEYALAWSLVNSLLCDEKGRKVFNAMLASLRSGKKTLHGYTPEHYASLEAHWKKHIEERIGPACKGSEGGDGEEVAAAMQEELLKNLKHEDWETRRSAALLLYMMTADAEPVLPVLTAGLTDKEAEVRSGAAKALGILGPDAKDAIPALRKALKDADASVRKAAAGALKRIRSGQEEEKVEPPKKPKPKRTSRL